jgi:hypothetical protein
MERPILDYQTHQQIYGPLLAQSVANQFVGMHVTNEFRLMMEEV